MADWSWPEIKSEYITNPKTSFRKLAEKYGLHKDTIWKKAKEEGWEDLRRQHIDDTQTKILNADTEQKVGRAVRLMTVADKLLEKVEQSMNTDMVVSAAALKNLSDAIKNIKEVQMIRTDEDIEEQKARIAKLRKEAEKEDQENKEIKVTMESDIEVYSK